MPNKPLDEESPLTLKQRRFIKRITEGKTPSEAASLSGYGPSYGNFLYRQPNIKRAIIVAMEKAGLSDALLAQKLREGLDAMVPPRKDGGKLYPDHFVRKQFLVEIFKLRGDYAPEEKVNTEKHVIQLVLGPGLKSALKDALSPEEADFLDAEIIEEHESEDAVQSAEPGLVEREVSDRPLLPMSCSSADPGK